MSGAARKFQRAKRRRTNSQARSAQAEAFRRVDPILRMGIELEAAILAAEIRIRELSKRAYGAARLDARLTSLGVAGRLLEVRSLVAGNATRETEERLALLTAIYQGSGSIEKLISEGQYIKAAAAIKQDVEIVARLEQLLTEPERRKEGETPNVRFVPPEIRRMYGQLNDVAHITKHELLVELLQKAVEGEARGLSPVPVLHENTACALYDLHLWLLLRAVLHHVSLLQALYGENIVDELHTEMELIVAARRRLRDEAGWIEGDATAQSVMDSAK